LDQQVLSIRGGKCSWEGTLRGEMC